MMRKILAVVGGIVAAFALVFIIEAIAHRIWPPPPGLDLTNPESLKNLMEQMPTGAVVSVAVAWIVGALGGGWLAARIAGILWPAWVVGGLVALAGISNLVMMPHPFWFWIVALVLVPLAAHFAGTLGVRSARGGATDPATA